MKIQSLVLATSLALLPATVALADDAKKEALKKAKEEAKKKAIEAAKEKSEAKTKVAKAKAESKKVDAEALAKAAEEEKQTHARHTGLIERLEQVATATNNAELTATVAKLKEKEAKRHALATPAAS